MTTEIPQAENEAAGGQSSAAAEGGASLAAVLAGCWPRGKYNGRRIVGASLKVRFNMAHWAWKPRYAWNFGMLYVGWLCVAVFCGSGVSLS